MRQEPIRIGISRCLLGDLVRYDGGHKRNDVIVAHLSPWVEWVPVCPEVEAGMGLPREPMHLVQSGSTIRLMTVATQVDRTEQLANFSAKKMQELKGLNLSGFIFKARSPSCGVQNVPVHNKLATSHPQESGLFARVLRNAFPLIPITDEDHLANLAACKCFFGLVSAYRQKRYVKTSNTSLTLTPRRYTTPVRQRRQPS